MRDKIEYIDNVFRFEFDGKFKERFESVGSPLDQLDIWYKNAQVYEAAVNHRPIEDSQKTRLLTMIEAIRVVVMRPPLPGDPIDIDLEPYEFSEDLKANYYQFVYDEILRQESKE